MRVYRNCLKWFCGHQPITPRLRRLPGELTGGIVDSVCMGSVGEEGGDIGLHVGTEGIADRYLMVVDYDISALYGTDFGEVHDE